MPCVIESVSGISTTVTKAGRASSSDEKSIAAIEDALPAFVTVVLIPLTLSITQGILWGFLLHALLYGVAGRWREVSVTLWLLAALSAGLLLLGH